MAERDRAVPAGTVTFLLTDIEGSTARWERAPDAMRRALARHDALLHEGIAAHGGMVLTERGEGDSFFALFARASDALAAACTIQRALIAEPWPEAVAPLRVRMALHSGESGLQDGWDHRGAAVNRCARLRAVAHGGQALLSGATYELVCDQLPPQASLRDLGLHRLKDLTRPEQVYQLVHPDLPDAFPPLTSLEAHRHTLPVQLTPFIGREREVAAVSTRLLESQTQLLTLTGPGGVGKTRLALQVAAEVVEAFPDGVFVVNLAPISDPRLILPAIAQMLGVVEQAGQPLVQTLQARLRNTRTLLLLDNFEQVVKAAPQVKALLATGSGVTVLVTSRAILHLQGEREYAVPPLSLPNAQRLPSLEALAQSEAVRLFIARAQDIKLDFALTPGTAPAVAAICVRLDGLPLAIELAAARLRVLPPQVLVNQLSSRLQVLRGGARDLPARQQTLRATIDWSYQLLTPDEQSLFMRLAVFVGGCTLEAVEAICNADGRLDVLEEVESLVAQSLLRQEEGDGEPRFTMLETVREYALECLAVSGETEALRRAHAQYFLALVEAEGLRLRGPEQGAWLARLEREHDNLRAALAWARASGEAGVGLRLALALRPFWFRRGYLSEGREWLEALLTLQGGSDDHEMASLQSRALGAAADLADAQGDLERARILCEYDLARQRARGDALATAWAEATLAGVVLAQGDCARSAQLSEASLAAARDAEDKHLMAFSIENLSSVALMQGDLERARRLAEESLDLFRAIEDDQRIAFSLMHLGDVAFAQGNLDHAKAAYEESRALYQDGRAGSVAFLVFTQLAQVLHAQGDVAPAIELLEEALSLHRDMGNLAGVAHVACVLGGLLHLQGKDQQAVTLLEEALSLHQDAGNRAGRAEASVALGRVLHAKGDRAHAHALLEEGLALSRDGRDRSRTAEILQALGQLMYEEGDAARARAALEESLAIDRESGQTARIAWTLGTLGQLARDRGDLEQAIAHIRESVTLSRIAGPMWVLAVGLERLAGLATVIGQADRAARLFGAAEALRAAHGIPIWPANRVDYEHDVSMTRAALGRDRFADEWATGRTLLPEQAIGLVLEDHSG